METELIIVRHGETDWNQSWRFQGQQDINLNGRGLEQAGLVSKYLANYKIDKVYSSDLKRAYRTAEKIAFPHGLMVESLKGLREMNFGEWEGLSFQDIQERYPDIHKKWVSDPTSIHPPGGEKIQAFQNRVVKTFNKIVSESLGNKIVVVSHGGAIRVFIAYLLDMPLRYYWKMESANCGINIVKYYGDNQMVTLLNGTHHLNIV